MRRLLDQCPGEPLCDACLAFACSVSLTEMRAATGTLARLNGYFAQGPGSCSSCRRATTVIAPRDSPPRCAHCRRPIDHGEEPRRVEEDVFHQSCWRLRRERLSGSGSTGGAGIA